MSSFTARLRICSRPAPLLRQRPAILLNESGGEMNKKMRLNGAADFNYDNKANGTDFADLAANFNQGADPKIRITKISF
jgi:hypothetical protein